MITPKFIETAPPGKHADGQVPGMFLNVSEAGTRTFRLKYRIGGVERLLVLGRVGEVGLREAREAALNARALIAKGQDPVAERRVQRLTATESNDTFGALALRYVDVAAAEATWTSSNRVRVMGLLTNDAKALWRLPVQTITAPAVLAAVLPLATRAPASGRRLLALVRSVLDMAMALGHVEHNVVIGGKGRKGLAMMLPPKPRTVPRAAIQNMDELREFIRTMQQSTSALEVKVSVMTIAFTCLRISEVLPMKWSEIDFEGRVIVVPRSRMKTKSVTEPFTVPMSPQLVDLLQQWKKMTTPDNEESFVFGSAVSACGHVTKAGVEEMLARLSGGRHTAHGFRSSMSSWAHSQKDAKRQALFLTSNIERVLDHLVGTKVSRAYDRGLYIEERREILNAWARALTT